MKKRGCIKKYKATKALNKSMFFNKLVQANPDLKTINWKLTKPKNIDTSWIDEERGLI